MPVGISVTMRAPYVTWKESDITIFSVRLGDEAESMKDLSSTPSSFFAHGIAVIVRTASGLDVVYEPVHDEYAGLEQP